MPFPWSLMRIWTYLPAFRVRIVPVAGSSFLAGTFYDYPFRTRLHRIDRKFRECLLDL